MGEIKGLILGESLLVSGNPIISPIIRDAEVHSAAIESGTDYFVTLDRAHFLDNNEVQKEVPFPLVTPGDFLDWYRKLVKQEKI